MNKQGVKHTLVFSVMIILLLGACKHHEEEYHGISDKIEAKSKDYKGVHCSSEPFIEGVKTFEITEGGHTFLIPERKGQIQSYACTECHSKPLKEMKALAKGKSAHWNIKINHADALVMNCATCHNGDAMDELTSLTGTSIDFNRSYQLCSQCHSKQFDDWKGGAHGKRIGGWAPPRASMTCVNCHNPHEPHIKPKWPVRYNTQKVKERGH